MERFLNKIILINSAVFDLAEIELNGHTCIIGANNRGKTTLLRTIAFFYHPSNSKSALGIKSVENYFSDFYFHDHSPSYLIYEVETNSNRGPFHVLFYKSGGFINYRFVQGAYSRELYFDAQNKLVPLLVTEVIKNFNAAGIWCSNEMHEKYKYRDILYGKFRAKKKTTQKNLEQLYLFRGESQSDNIPKIIRDIFLNSNPRFAKELKSDFVKAFITNAVADRFQVKQSDKQEQTIDLQHLSVDLGNYLDHFEDIKTFRKTSHERAVIKDKFAAIKVQKQEQRQLAEQLGSTYKHAIKQLEVLSSQKAQHEADLAEQKLGLKDFLQQKEAEQTALNEKMGGLKGEIKLAEKAKIIWDSPDFQQHYQQYLQQEILEAQLKQDEKEVSILRANYQDVHLKYDQLFKNLENERTAYLTDWRDRKLTLDNQHQKQINALDLAERKEADQIKQHYTEQQESLKSSLQALQLDLKELETQAFIIKNKRYFDQEIKQLEEEKHQIKLQQADRKYQLNNLEKELTAWKKQLPSLQEACADIISKREETDKSRIANITTDIEKIQQQLKISPNSFYGYLNENVPNWFEHIGKICDESVLFKTDLSPQQAEELSQSLYGVQLDLTKLDVIAKSLEDYQKEIQVKQAEIAQIEQALQDFQQAQWEKRDREMDRVRKLMAEGNRNIEKNKHEQNLATRKLETIATSITDYQLQATELIDQKIKENKALQDENRQKSESLSAQIQAFTQSQEAEIEKVNALYANKKAVLKEQKTAKLDTLHAEKAQLEEKWAAKKSEIEANRKVDLDGKGVDVQVLETLEGQIASTTTTLNQIYRFKKEACSLGGNYEHFIQHHKPNSIDALPELYEEQRKIREGITEIKQQKTAKSEEYDRLTNDLNEEINRLKDQLKEYKRGIEKFQQFQNESHLWHQYRAIIENAEALPAIGSEPIDLIYMRLMNTETSLNKAYEVFKQMTLKFINQFRTNNSFGLSLADQGKNVAYERLAENIEEIQSQQTIERIELETLQQKIQLMNVISREITQLKSQLGKVRKAVDSISRDISNSGFTDSNLIVSFEMKVQETNNRVMLQLEKIANLKEENNQQFHEMAYSRDLLGHDLDKRSTDMLQYLKEAIDEGRQEELRLQDMFELAFSYDDKRNKKTNVTNIDDIGSEGTTVLIKSCIYISLLHFFAKKGKIFNQQTYLHCIIDEVGKISEPYLKTLLDFAYERHIYLLNALPNKSKLETYYNYTYKLREVNHGDQFIAKVDRLLSKTISLKTHAEQN